MGKKIIIKGANFSENGFPISVVKLAVKGLYTSTLSSSNVLIRENSDRGMICINVDDATVPFQAGIPYSAIEIPSGATSVSCVCNQQYSVLLCTKNGKYNINLFDSGWKTANIPTLLDLTQYPTAFYLSVNLNAVESVAVENIAWTLEFE